MDIEKKTRKRIFLVFSLFSVIYLRPSFTQTTSTGINTGSAIEGNSAPQVQPSKEVNKDAQANPNGQALEEKRSVSTEESARVVTDQTVGKDEELSLDETQIKAIDTSSNRSLKTLSSIENLFLSALGTDELPIVQFGYDFFNNAPVQTSTAIGDDYVVGPGDEIIVYLWGDAIDISEAEYKYELTIDRNGTCFFPPIGGFQAWGLDLNAMKNFFRTALAKKYKKFDLGLTIGKPREFPIFVSGFVNKPGTMMINSMSTLFDVLSKAGGIKKTGSLRNIEIKRKSPNQGTISIDLYDVLISGKNVDVRLKEGDAVLVKEIGKVVGVSGEMKRPAIYEVKDENNVGTLFSLAGGYLPSAYTKRLTIIRFTDEERKIIEGDLRNDILLKMELMDGDLVKIDKVKDFIGNKVEISGVVKFPGSYTIEQTPTVNALFEKAKIMADTNLYYGRIYRVGKAGISENMTFVPARILDGSQTIKLEPQDLVVLYRFGEMPTAVDFNAFPNTVLFQGSVKYPGMYTWYPGLKLSDLFSSDALLLTTNLNYAEIRRRKIESRKTNIIVFRPDETANRKIDFALEKLDTVVFFPRSEEEPVKLGVEARDYVSIVGPVKYKGLFAWYEGMRLSSVFDSDSLQTDTNLEYAEIRRTLIEENKETILTFQPRDEIGKGNSIPLLKLDRIQFFPKMLYLPIEVSGEVEESKIIPYFPNINLFDVLRTVTIKADPRMLKAFIYREESDLEGKLARADQIIYLNDLLEKDTVSGFLLKQGDKIVIRRISEEEKQPQVLVRGRVVNPGTFHFRTGMRLYDALVLAGGFNDGAYPKGLVLLRETAARLQRQQIDRAIKTLDLTLQENIQQSSQNATADNTEALKFQIQSQKAQLDNLTLQANDILGRITIDIPENLEDLKNSTANILLDENDSIYIPRIPTFVQILGDVFNPVMVSYQENLLVRKYISDVGGVKDSGDIENIYIIRANGTVVSPKQYQPVLFTVRTVENEVVKPGDTIVVPSKVVISSNILPIISEVTTIISDLASTAFSVYAIIAK